MKVTVVSGSHRTPSQSMKVSEHIRGALEATGGFSEVEIFGLNDNPLPLWDQGVWEGAARWSELLDPLRARLQASDAFVIVSPEWHGQVPAGLKNFFLLCSARELGHKPALIVTVSSGDGGSYPVAELRMSSYKNNRLCYLPEHVIIRNVERVLNEDAADNDSAADQYFRARIAWNLEILHAYALALKGVRESGITHNDLFKNGM
ncbi:MAG: NAD(P)H-dependent oxidoreductase [Gammaproteobacteria bacterium]|nr:NAD(P)H-dependent oxidoreductase [Gammaproteobacteria bacterium]